MKYDFTATTHPARLRTAGMALLLALLLAACDKHDKKNDFTLVTQDATDVTDHSATLKGSLSASNVSGTYTAGFFIAEEGTPAANNYDEKIEVGTGVKGEFKATKLFQPGRTYHYRTYVHYSDSIYQYGGTMSFTTSNLAPRGKGTQSVLVYIAGDNNLSSFVMDDVAQMMEGSKQLGSDSNLLLFIDQQGRKPYFLLVENGDTIRQETSNTELKTSDTATLTKAMKWMADYYPADHYGLVLWGHADGWIIRNDNNASRPTGGPRHAYGQDTTGGEQWMDIPDMAEALASTGVKLRFIFADCCCFQSVESAYELRQCTDYIIASAAEIPGEGAPYQTVIPALFSQSADFYQQAADAYYRQVSYGYQEPMSVVKTSAMENLAQATRTALLQCMPQKSDTQEEPNFPDVEGLIYYYDQSLFDMNDFMLRHASGSTYTQWHQALKEAVPYSTMTTVWMSNNHVPYLDSFNQSTFRDFEITEERYCGVSMYVLQNPNSVASRYRNTVTRQLKNIGKMQWYTAAGLDLLGW